jgi:hypothetical protein
MLKILSITGTLLAVLLFVAVAAHLLRGAGSADQALEVFELKKNLTNDRDTLGCFVVVPVPVYHEVAADAAHRQRGAGSADQTPAT